MMYKWNTIKKLSPKQYAIVMLHQNGIQLKNAFSFINNKVIGFESADGFPMFSDQKDEQLFCDIIKTMS